jgi:hypothetical protein
VLKSCARCIVQRDKTAFSKLGASDDQTIVGDIVIAKMDGFGHPQSGTGEQREECAVGVSAQSSITRLGYRLY